MGLMSLLDLSLLQMIHIDMDAICITLNDWPSSHQAIKRSDRTFSKGTCEMHGGRKSNTTLLKQMENEYDR